SLHIVVFATSVVFAGVDLPFCFARIPSEGGQVPLVSYLPKPLKHGLTEADIVVVAHVPTVDKDCTLRALVPRTLEFVSIRVGHVIYRTRKRRVRIVRSHNVLGLCLSSLVHLLNLLHV